MLAERDPDAMTAGDAPLPADDQPADATNETRRRRHRWRTRSPFEVLTLGESAQAERQALRCGVADARDAVAILREELASLAHANAEPACALLRERFAYADQLRHELAAAEARLEDLRIRRQELLLELRGLRGAAARLGRRDPFPSAADGG